MLDAAGPLAAVHAQVDGAPVVVLWERAASAAAAFRPLHEGRRLTFEVRGGAFVDLDTDSTWRVDGRAVAGPLAGTRLEPVPEAYVAFWFAWALFQPRADLWTAG